MCVGDSITKGFGGTPAVDPCALTATNLSNFLGTTITPLNYGQIGTTSADWLPTAMNFNFSNAVGEIATVGAANVPWVIITLGTNDAQAANQWSAATYASNMEAIVAGFVAHGINKVVLNQMPWIGNTSSPWNASSETFELAYVQQFPTIAAANPTNTFLGNQTLHFLTQYNPNLYSNVNDMIHLSGANQDNVAGNPGYTELAVLWANAIEGLFYLSNGAGYWQNVIDPWRATDWTQAGIPSYSPNDPPSDSWTQYGSTVAAYGTSGSPASCSTITAAFSGIGTNQYVKLGTGTFYLNAGCLLQGYNKAELRGSGPQSTKLVFSGSTGCGHGLGDGLVCLDATDSTYASGNPTGVNWTAGFNKGANQITIASGSSIVAGTTTLVLDQLDDGCLGAGTCAGESIDSSNYFNCQYAYNPNAQSVGTVTITNGTNVSGSGFSAAYGSEILLSISGVITSVPFIYINSTTGALGFAVANGSYTATFPTGCSYNNSVNASRPNRGQEEYVQVVSCSPSCGTNSSTVVTISPPLIHPNWNPSQSPQAWLIQSSHYVGIRDLTIDATSTTYSGTTWCAEGYNLADSWVYDVVFKSCANTTLYGFQMAQSDWHSNYIYNSGQSSPSTDNSAMNFTGGSNFIGNNICHNCHLALILNGPASGNVIADNFMVNDFTGNAVLFNAIFDGHGNGDDYNLFEGNIAPSEVQDQPHGTHLMETWYRNFLPGWESCANGNCGSSTAKTDQLEPVMDLSFDRYKNYVGNILGTPALTYTGYIYAGTVDYYTSGPAYAWNIGSGNGASPTNGGYPGGPIPLDPQTQVTMLRAGNWDAYSAATRWTQSEAATGTPVWPNFAPDQTCTSSLSCPASFAFAARPNWYLSSIPFPAIGPDVSGGNVGICTGTINTSGEQAGLPATSSSQCPSTSKTTAWAGHVNANPAMACYLSLGGLPDGTGGALSFNANTCYNGSSGITGAPTPAAFLSTILDPSAKIGDKWDHH
jgi:lysophospholipase L1-like esterase